MKFSAKTTTTANLIEDSATIVTITLGSIGIFSSLFLMFGIYNQTFLSVILGLNVLNLILTPIIGTLTETPFYNSYDNKTKTWTKMDK